MGTALTLEAAVTSLRSGGVVAYPTEAVWGLGCDPADERAVHRILQIKQRPVEKGMILIAASLDQLKPYLDLTILDEGRLQAVTDSWPGPNTWVMPASLRAPRWITGAHSGIAVRVSAHPEVIALCEAFDGALVSTSANPAGAEPARSLEQFDPALREAIDGWVPGAVGTLASPTVIRVAQTGQVLRT